MNGKHKILNVKSFLILILLLFVAVGIMFDVKDKKDKEAFDRKKLEVQNDEVEMFCSGDTYRFQEYLNYFEWNKEDIDAVVLGLDTDENRAICDYYINDKEIIEEIMSIMESITFYGGVNDETVIGIVDERKWELQFIKDDKEYAIKLNGRDTIYENVESIDFYASDVDNSSRMLSDAPDISKFMGGYYTVLKEENIYDDLLNIHKKYVDEITKEELVELCISKSSDLTKYFCYEHTLVDDINYDDEDMNGIVILVYNLPIKGTDFYLELRKHNEGGTYDMEGNELVPPCNDFISAEIYNQEGGKLDLHKCSVNDLKDFLNRE